MASRCLPLALPSLFLAVSVCLTLAPVGAVRADVVHLKTGRTVEGETAPGKKPGTTEVRTGGGITLVIPDADIVRIEKRRSPKDELEARLAALASDDMDGLKDLLAYARDKRLSKDLPVIARRILALDPNDEVGRKVLGYVVYDNRWVLEAELKKRQGLVEHEGEWMTEAERDRRVFEVSLKEVEELLDLVDSDNAYVQEFSIRKILARRDPAAREVFLKHLQDPRRVPRMVATRGLVYFPVEGSGDETARRAAADLHRLGLEERDADVLKVVLATTGKFFPQESFRLALGTITSSSSGDERRRAADLLYAALRKAAVPGLCRALIDPRGGASRPEVLGVLRRALGVDLGYDVDAWLRFWRENEAQFSDE